MAVVAGCQEVQGGCLEGCLGKACGAFGGFEREGCLGKACGGFGGFEGFPGGQTAALNARKNRWPWCFWVGKACVSGVALKCCKRCKGPAWRVALERLAEGRV